jgi:hypothetical protein
MVYVSGVLSKDRVAKFRENFRGAQEQTKLRRRVVAVEMNLGCSNNCPFCQMSSEKGPKRPIPPDLLYIIGEERVIDPRTSSPRIMLQYANEPGDYSFAGWNATDVARHLSSALLKRGLAPEISITTAVPAGKEDWFLRIIKEDIKGLDIRLSFSFMNEKRLTAIPEFQKLCEEFDIKKQDVIARFTIGQIAKIEKPRVEWDPTIKVAQILGTDKFAHIRMEQSGTDIEGLVSVDNQMAFSKKVLAGEIMEGQTFRMQLWEPYNAIGPGNSWIQMRNWDILPIGKAYSEESNIGREGSDTNLILVRSDGSIHHITGTKATADNPSGHTIRELYGPIY